MTSRNTKAGGDRRVLLHPEAERYLRPILLPTPIEPEARDRWARTPAFRKRGTSELWDRTSYRDAWVDMLAPVD